MSDDNSKLPEADPLAPSLEAPAEREHTFSRRALLRAGWVAPVVLAVAVPERAFALSSHLDTTGFHDSGNVFCDGSGATHCDAPNFSDT
jgi:hypothetical protein